MDLPFGRLSISMRPHACIAVASFLFSLVWWFRKQRDYGLNLTWSAS